MPTFLTRPRISKEMRIRIRLHDRTHYADILDDQELKGGQEQ